MKVTVDYILIVTWFAFASMVDFAITHDGKGVMLHKDLELDCLERISLTTLMPEVKGLSPERLSELNATGELKALLYDKLTSHFVDYKIEVI